jgi:hypothetical protein
MTIWTAAWSTKLPPGHTRVRISRGGPRWLPAGSYKTYSAFFPGKWFKSVSPPEYLDLYNAILAKLDPKRVVADLEALGPNPTYCHRHLAAKWLEDTIGIKVEEVGHPDLPRFRYLNKEHVAAPSYARRERVDLFP